MEIKIGIAKTNKYAVAISGDSVEVTERPQGGVSVILADGQGSGRSAQLASRMVVAKAAVLIAEGVRDGAVARTVHDYLYMFKDGKVSATLTLMSVDLDSQTLVFCRNSNCPVIIKQNHGIDVYDEEVASIGVHKRMKPLTVQLPLEEGLIAVTYTDGIQHSGRRRGNEITQTQLLKLIEKTKAEDVDALAQAILDQALLLDQNMPGDDMTVVVVGICPKERQDLSVRRMVFSLPC